MSKPKVKYCKRGHLQKESNIYISPNGWSTCKLCKKIRAKLWKQKNKQRYNKKMRLWQRKNPWYESFMRIKQRCNNIKDKDYKYYGGRGIKCLITKETMKFLWFRDKPYLMKKASIDRIDNNGNYTLKNCEFIEQSENSRKDKIGKKFQKKD